MPGGAICVRSNSRVVQFNPVKISLFPLDKSDFPSASKQLLSLLVRAKETHERVGQEGSCGAIKPGCSDTVCRCGHSRGAAGEENFADGVFITGNPLANPPSEAIRQHLREHGW